VIRRAIFLGFLGDLRRCKSGAEPGHHLQFTIRQSVRQLSKRGSFDLILTCVADVGLDGSSEGQDHKKRRQVVDLLVLSGCGD
jgi:hypothetical protein